MPIRRLFLLPALCALLAACAPLPPQGVPVGRAQLQLPAGDWQPLATDEALLAALDEEATPRYDRRVGAMLADRGMHIAALTPDRFAEWLAEVMS